MNVRSSIYLNLMKTYGLFKFIFFILKSYHAPMMTSIEGSFILKFKIAHPCISRSSVQDYNTLLNTKFRSLFYNFFSDFFFN